jgi:NAD(P)-dependent dehydrogenase (short-subunit alcohol dehydrogenase family)
VGIGREMSRVVLITGASSGFGQAAAGHLAARGWRVFGTSRGAAGDQRAGEEREGITMLPLDVRSDESVAACVKEVMDRAGRIDALVNNAGYALGGAVEEISIDEAKAHFETNFWGAARMMRAVLPIMREQRAGRIVNVSSLAGLVGVPFHAYYSATKFAIEGLSEGLREEVRGFGIHVSLIEPGDFKTGGTAARERPAQPLAAYKQNADRAVEVMAKSEQSGPDPILFARLLERILNSPRPRLRYRLGSDAAWVPRIRAVIPESTFQWALRKNYQIE